MPDEKRPTSPAERPGAAASAAPASKPPADHGADSMLRCYNSTEWRLEELFGSEDDLKPQAKPAESPRKK